MRDHKVMWTQQMIVKIESGKRPVRLAEAVELATVLGVGLDALIQDPLSRAISEVQFSYADAERRWTEANAARHRLDARLWCLKKFKAAHLGQVVNIGPDPVLRVLDAFDRDDWDQTTEILMFLGADDADVSAIKDLALDQEAESPWLDAAEAIWALLQAMLPTLQYDLR